MAGDDSKPGEPKDEVLKLIWKVAAAAVSITGVLAMGGAVAWARFDAAELPAPQAVALIGRSELIATGAFALLGFVLGGLVAVACAYGLDRYGHPSFKESKAKERLKGVKKEERPDHPRTLYGLMAVVALEVSAAIALTLDGWERWVAAPAPIVALLILVFVAKAKTQRKNAGKVEGWLCERHLWPEGRVSDARYLLILILLVLLVPLITVAVIGSLVGAGNSWFVVVYLALAVSLGWLCYGVAAQTGRQFLWFGVTLFLTVVLFGAGVALMRTYYAPKLQPLAAVLTFKTEREIEGETRTVQAAMSGIYIAETDNRLYFGLIDTLRPGSDGEVKGKDANPARRDNGSIFWVSCDDIVTYAVGSPQRIEVALDEGAKTLLDDLERQPITDQENVPDPNPTGPGAEAPATPAGTCRDE